MNLIQGDCLEVLKTLPSESVQTCVTSPPYWGLRDYGVEGQLGLEKSPDEYVAKMLGVFREVRRVLKNDGTLWLNLGDSYAANFYSELKPKDLVGIPWRMAFALQADGWYLRQDIIWHKPNPMPESIRDRCTKAHEYIFLLSKSPKYYFDNEAIKEPSKFPAGNGNRRLLRDPGMREGENANTRGSIHLIGPRETRNRRSVWTVTTKPFKGAHFATFPPDLIEPCVLAGAPLGATVLDPFSGAGTTGLVALKHGRHYVGIELNPEYHAIARMRMIASAGHGPNAP